jgi:lipoate-protein ligase A
MGASLAVIDSGVTEGRRNIAIGRALMERHLRGEIGDTLRFLRFPPTALVGRHQVLDQEVDLDYCRSAGIGLARRITGGGAIYLDPGQLGWELVLSRSRLPDPDLGTAAQLICEAAAEGLRSLGVNAAFRPRNDIEVNGRKLGGTGGFFDGGTLFYQGTVLVDLDPEVMVAALRIPTAKLAKRALDSGAQRVVTLRELTGRGASSLGEIQDALASSLAAGLGLRAKRAALDDQTLELAKALYEEEIGSDAFVDEVRPVAPARGVLSGEHTGPGGTIRTDLRLQGAAQKRIGVIQFTGDFFVAPPRVVLDLEGALRGVATDRVGETLERFFDEAVIETLSVRPGDFAASVAAALRAGAR